MVRYKLINGHIKVAYGKDQVMAEFIAITDNRLEW